MGELEIARAGEGDLDGVLDLLARNQPDRGGSLSASFARPQLAAMFADMPTIVARRDGKVVGFLITYVPKGESLQPIIRAMLAAYAGGAGAYVYGPICVDAAERGRGIARAMFDELRRLLPGREGILFIRRDNPASLRAHAKMGMREVGSFVFGGRDHVILAYIG